ncbi:Protein CBR-NPR-9 [Caenorhabditis briggsae]|uniref:Protein CBR-NPR-9 n=1 Tax=Caenorhabditis briggsae TaxID=6238 RepID=A8XQW6_CAEBR|nr:Protein CBR-NPR-9 [Caenorhabditis briggsae]CAP35041.2 Protein CBR-NPR-9 [Caenorhabditis briggsae]
MIGLIGNALVVIVAFGRQMRNSTNTLIIGLAISDLMFLLLCVPFTAIDYAVPTWIFPEWTCSMINFFQVSYWLHTSAYCSVWTLTLMALDRFLAVVYPVESITVRTPRNTMIALFILYTIIVCSQIPVGRMHGIYVYDFILEKRSTCAILTIATAEATPAVARTYFMTFNLFGYVLLLESLLLGEKRKGKLLLIKVANRDSSSIRRRPEATAAKRKVTRLVLCVLITWALCWLPLNVCFFMSGLAYPEPLVISHGVIMVIVQIASQVLAYTNSCLNPILYALMSHSFREGFIRIMKMLINKMSRGKFCTNYRRSALRTELTHYNQTPAHATNTVVQVTNGERSTLLKDSSTTTTTSVQPLRTSIQAKKTKAIGRSKSTRSYNL